MRGACSNKKTIRVVREPLKGLKLNQLRGLLRAPQTIHVLAGKLVIQVYTREKNQQNNVPFCEKQMQY